MENFIDLVLKRESCRSFDPTKDVPQELITQCLEAARNAPSACNSQPWSFHVVTSEQLFPAVLCSLQENGANPFASNAKAIVIVCEETAVLMSENGFVKSQKYAWSDIGQAVAYFTLAASDLGLSTCILGRINPEKIAETLSLSNDSTVRLAIVVGYAAQEDVRTKKRKSLRKVSDFR